MNIIFEEKDHVGYLEHRFAWRYDTFTLFSH
jgi:hypothetical protein